MALVLTTTLGWSGSGAAAAPAASPDRDRMGHRSGDARWLERQLRDLQEVGAVGAVALLQSPQGGVRAAAGRATTAPGRPARPAAEFRTASVTKPMVAVLALQLVDRGTWTLDTTIGDVLPRLWPRHEDVTLRELLSHTSGMPDHLAGVLGDVRTPRQLVQRVSHRYHDPGLVAAAKRQPWQDLAEGEQLYSNAGYVVVGMMLREQTGLPVARLMRSRVFGPAGMARSRFATDREVRRPFLHEYARWNRRLVDLGSFHPTLFSSAGAVVTTARDLGRFHRALSRGELLSTASLSAMRSVQVPTGADGLGYGLGSYRLPDPCRSGSFLHGHDGASFATLTMSFSRPAGGTRVTVSMTGRQLARGAGEDVVALQTLALRAIARTCGSPAVTTRTLPALPGDPARSLVAGGLR